MNPPGVSNRSLMVRMSLSSTAPVHARALDDLGDRVRLPVAELRDQVEDAAELRRGGVGHAAPPS